MQIPALNTQATTTATGQSSGIAPQRALPQPAGRPALSGALAAAFAMPGAGLSSLDTGFNLQASALQQAQAFIGKAQDLLTSLKTGLGDALAGQQAADARVQGQLQRFSAFWETRPMATAGSIDGQLQLRDAGEAQQNFRLRGLDAPGFEVSDTEKLQFSVGGRLSSTVVLEPGLPVAVTARRLDLALAPLGIRVAADAKGVLQFGAAEGAWPALRDSLMIKGEGRRFPTGQFNRVRIDATPERIQPSAWQIDSPTALRQTLREVVVAGQQLDDAKRATDSALVRLGTSVSSGADAEQAQRARNLATHLETQAQTASFSTLAGMLPASRGLTRERVTALLKLG